MTQVPTQLPVQHEEQETDVLVDHPAKVILFNDDVHSFDEVIEQLMKATSCTATKAESLAWEVHTKGKALVFEGPMDDCLRVSHILEEIALNTQIEL